MNGPPTRIVVADIRVPFLRLVLLFVKCALEHDAEKCEAVFGRHHALTY